MKKTIVLFALFCTLSVVKAQKKQNVYFFKNNGKEVESKDSADFIRVIQEPDSGEMNLVLQEFYVNGKKKTLGKLSAFEPRLVFEGVVLRYNNLGKRISVTTYEHGSPTGMGYRYYGDGVTLNEKIAYVQFTPGIDQMIGNDSEFSGTFLNPNSKLMYLADSSGVVHIKDGNGHLSQVISTDKSNQRIEEGDYKDGLKDGTWTGKETRDGFTYTETYQLGKLILGESIKDGKKYSYTATMEPPQFRGGPSVWNNYIKNTLKYPADAQRAGVTGVVSTNFTVDKDGSITDIKIIKSVYPSIDEEARRVLMYSPKWTPAKMRGVPVKLRYSQSFNFKF